MRLFKANHVLIAGNISDVRIQNGQHGQFGSISIAVDDGYFKKGDNNNQQGEWIDRTHFVECNVNSNFLKKLKVTPAKGDMLSIEGKLTLDKWKDNTGKDRSALKVTASDVVGYIPKVGVVAMKAACGNNNQSQGSGGYQQNNQNQNGGGYQKPQQNGGGYQQNNQNQNGGGYQKPQQNGGGYQQNGDGYQPQGH